MMNAYFDEVRDHFDYAKKYFDSISNTPPMLALTAPPMLGLTEPRMLALPAPPMLALTAPPMLGSAALIDKYIEATMKGPRKQVYPVYLHPIEGCLDNGEPRFHVEYQHQGCLDNGKPRFQIEHRHPGCGLINCGDPNERRPDYFGRCRDDARKHQSVTKKQESLDALILEAEASQELPEASQELLEASQESPEASQESLDASILKAEASNLQQEALNLQQEESKRLLDALIFKSSDQRRTAFWGQQKEYNTRKLTSSIAARKLDFDRHKLFYECAKPHKMLFNKKTYYPCKNITNKDSRGTSMAATRIDSDRYKLFQKLKTDETSL